MIETTEELTDELEALEQTIDWSPVGMKELRRRQDIIRELADRENPF